MEINGEVGVATIFRTLPRHIRPTAAVLLFLILGLSACEKLEQKYIRQDKLFRIAQIEDSRADDTLLFSPDVLGDSDPEIRAKAALAIGRIGNDIYVNPLALHLADTVPSVARTKCFAAGLFGDSILFDGVLAIAQNDSAARAAAVEALGRDASGTQAARIAAFLDDIDSQVVYQAMFAFWRADEWSQAPKMTAIGLSSGNRLVQYGALYALSRGGRPEGRELFHDFVSDADPDYRMLAYRGLGRIADSAAVKTISSGLNDDDMRIVEAAMRALGQFGSLGTAYIAERLPGLTDEKAVTLGIETIGANHDFSKAAGVVGQTLRSDRRENVTAAAIKSLLQIEGVDALALIDEIVKRPTTYQRLKLAEGLASIDPKAAEARLTPLFNDTAPTVRAAALQSLCDVDSTKAMRLMEKALTDSDYVVIATAVEIAARRKATLLIPAIAAIYMEKRSFLPDDVKRSIIDACTEFGANTAHDSLLVAVLEEGCNDEWFIIRKEASEALWETFGIDRRNRVGLARSKIENHNYRELFEKYDINPRAKFETARGSFTVELLYRTAPKTVDNFIALAGKHFYDGLIFHRVVPNFVVQSGCPRGDGWGGPGYTIRSEFNRESYTTGAVGMATSGKDTGGSQFFITLSPQPHLDARYTLFGRVTDGMDVVQQIVRGDTIRSVIIDTRQRKK